MLCWILNKKTNSKIYSKNCPIDQFIKATDSIVVYLQKFTWLMKDDLGIKEYRKIYREMTV